MMWPGRGWGATHDKTTVVWCTKRVKSDGSVKFSLAAKVKFSVATVNFALTLLVHYTVVYILSYVCGKIIFFLSLLK